MGGGRMTADDWGTYTATNTRNAKTVKDIYKNDRMKSEFNPINIKVREALDSPDSPESTPIIIALDVTGSMGFIPDVMVRTGLWTLATEIYDRKPISDPHIMFMAVGDPACDEAPLQCTQFETDIRIAEQLKELWLEGRGGGNDSEGYNLPWYFAANKCVTDSFNKRNKKGYLITIGDEEVPYTLTKEQIKRVIGDDVESDLTNEQLLSVVQRSWNVYHFIINEGSHYRHYGKRVDSSWRNLMGQQVFNVSDHTKLAEIIVSVIQEREGLDAAAIIKSWDGSTAVAVSAAFKSNSKDLTVSNGGGVIEFD